MASGLKLFCKARNVVLNKGENDRLEAVVVVFQPTLGWGDPTQKSLLAVLAIKNTSVKIKAIDSNKPKRGIKSQLCTYFASRRYFRGRRPTRINRNFHNKKMSTTPTSTANTMATVNAH